MKFKVSYEMEVADEVLLENVNDYRDNNDESLYDSLDEVSHEELMEVLYEECGILETEMMNILIDDLSCERI